MITADDTELMHQAPMAVNTYLIKAVKSIDGQFGTGFSRKHPELVAAFLRASAMEFQTSVIARSLETVAEALKD
jgi:hypothetical protein